MARVLGYVLTEKGRGLGALLVTAYAVTGNVGGSEGRRQRLAAVTTGGDGSFCRRGKGCLGTENER
jgi:hypothetical protein